MPHQPQLRAASSSPDRARDSHPRHTDSSRTIPKPVTLDQFESLITVETRRIQVCLMDTLERSGFSPDRIDAVVRTGGSAQIPCSAELLGRISDPEKVVLSDVFNGVTAGLAIRAHIGKTGAGN